MREVFEKFFKGRVNKIITNRELIAYLRENQKISQVLLYISKNNNCHHLPLFSHQSDGDVIAIYLPK